MKKNQKGSITVIQAKKMFMASSKILLKPLQHDILEINKG